MWSNGGLGSAQPHNMEKQMAKDNRYEVWLKWDGVNGIIDSFEWREAAEDFIKAEQQEYVVNNETVPTMFVVDTGETHDS